MDEHTLYGLTINKQSNIITPNLNNNEQLFSRDIDLLLFLAIRFDSGTDLINRAVDSIVWIRVGMCWWKAERENTP